MFPCSILLRAAIKASDRGAGVKRASRHSPVLIQQGDHISDSLSVGFVGVELVAELNTIATASQKPEWLRACC